MALPRKSQVNNLHMTTMEKVNLGGDLLKDLHKMREKIVSKFSNFDEAISFGEVFRVNLYNTIIKLKKTDEIKKDTEKPPLDMQNLSFIKEDEKSSNSIVRIALCLFVLFL